MLYIKQLLQADPQLAFERFCIGAGTVQLAEGGCEHDGMAVLGEGYKRGLVRERGVAHRHAKYQYVFAIQLFAEFGGRQGIAGMIDDGYIAQVEAAGLEYGGEEAELAFGQVYFFLVADEDGDFFLVLAQVLNGGRWLLFVACCSLSGSLGSGCFYPGRYCFRDDDRVLLLPGRFLRGGFEAGAGGLIVGRHYQVFAI